MSTCNCDGTLSQDVADLWASLSSFSDVFGGVAPDTIETIACQNAVGQLQASGVDPCMVDEATLQAAYQAALTQAKSVAGSTPFSNTIQRGVDTTVGGQASAPIAPGTKPANSNNMIFIIGAIAILAIGFFLVMR